MVFPYFDYCSPVWSSFTTGLHNHLQILQNKLACVLVHADIRTPIDKIMEELNWLKLDDRWKRQLLLVTFKRLKEIAPVYMSSYVTFTHSTHNRFTRNHSSNILFVPSWNIMPVNVLFSIEPLLTGTNCLLVSDQTFLMWV